MRSISSKRHTFIKNLLQSQASLGCSWSRYDLARHRGVANGTQAHSLQTWNFECKSQTNWMTKNQKRETLNLWFFFFRSTKWWPFTVDPALATIDSCHGLLYHARAGEPSWNQLQADWNVCCYNRLYSLGMIIEKNRMQLFGNVQSSFRSTLHVLQLLHVHNDWSLRSFSHADLATLQYQATRQGQRPWSFGSRHFTISSHQTRPKAILPIFCLAHCYVDQFKPQLLLMLVIFQTHGKNSTTNHPCG